MDCLVDYIGIKYPGAPEPESGIYINSLAGISTEIIQKIADSEQQTYNSVWDDVQVVASKRLYADLIAKLKAKYKVSTARGIFRYEPVAGVAEPAAPEKRGILLDFGYTSFTAQSFYVGIVYLIATNSGNTILYIQDENGFVLDQFNVEFANGLNYYQINRAYSSEKLFIGFDMTTVATNASDISEGDFSNAVKRICRYSTPAAKGVSFETIYTETGINTHGVGVAGYTSCEHGAVVCYNKELFTSAWMFILGNQLMVETLGSNRSNAATTVDRSIYEQLRDIYQSDYEKQLQAVVDGINFEKGDCCMDCNENPRHVTWLP